MSDVIVAPITTPVQVTAVQSSDNVRVTVAVAVDTGVEVLFKGPPGRQGDAGPSGAGGGDITGVAAIALGGQRVVYLANDGLRYASADDLATINALGVTVGAVSIGGTATVRTGGALADPSFSFVPGPVYLGLNGLLTQTLPTANSLVVIGDAINATTLLVRVEKPWELA